MIFKEYFYLIMLAGLFLYAVTFIVAEWFANKIRNIQIKRARNKPPKPRKPVEDPPQPQIRKVDQNDTRAAIEIWRLSNRLNKINDQIPSAHHRGFESSLSKLTNYFTDMGVQIVDPTGEPYNDGANVDVIAFENDPNCDRDTVKETLEPSVYVNGELIKRAKIIVIQKGN